MRLVMAASMPWAEKLWGMPKIPNKNTSRTPMMSSNCQRRFLFMENQVQKHQVVRQLLRLNFFLRGRNLGHGGLGTFHHNVIGRNAKMNRIIFERHNCSPQAAAGHDLVAGLEAI